MSSTLVPVNAGLTYLLRRANTIYIKAVTVSKKYELITPPGTNYNSQDIKIFERLFVNFPRTKYDYFIF